jgi:hypothetical protein
MLSDFCPAFENFHFPIVITAPDAKTFRTPHNRIQMFPVTFWRKGAQFLPFDLLDGFPAFLVKADISDFHVVDYSMWRT